MGEVIDQVKLAHWKIGLEADIAMKLITVLSASLPMTEAMYSDGNETPIRPKYLAKLACDISAAFMSEALEREWIRMASSEERFGKAGVV